MNYNEIIAKTMKSRQFGQHMALVNWGYTAFAKVDCGNVDERGIYYRREDKKGGVALARLTDNGAVEHLANVNTQV